MLKSMISREDILGTDLVSIRVRHSNNVDARDIAMESANVYKQRRTEIEEREVKTYLHELTKSVKAQEDKVKEREKMLSAIVSNSGTTLKESDSEITQKAGETTEDAINRSMNAPDYLDAKRELETALELLALMKLKLIGETISMNMPLESIVIHQMPVIAHSPISPNVTLNLMLGGLLGLLLSPLMTLPVIWVLNRR